MTQKKRRKKEKSNTGKGKKERKEGQKKMCQICFKIYINQVSNTVKNLEKCRKINRM